MKHYRKTSHAVYDSKYHLVWITTYRKPVLYGDVATRLRDLIREICKTREVEILTGHISKDQVPILVSVLPYVSVSDVIRRIKGKSSRKLLSDYRRLSQQFWGRHLWACGSFAATTGTITDAVIAQYIEMQAEMERARDDDISISE